MKIRRTSLDGVVLIEPQLFADPRGFFMETYHEAKFQQAGLDCKFVQDNHSRSVRNTLRGLHYQIVFPQGKLVRVIRGEIFDVAVDLRHDSPTFGRWHGTYLSETNHLQMYIPCGFAHGFCVITDVAEITYKCTEFYQPEYERVIAWNDSELAIAWPIHTPILSERDRKGEPFCGAPYFEDVLASKP